MTKDELQWALLAINNAPIQNTNEARYKAAALVDLANQLDDRVKSDSVQPDTDTEDSPRPV